MTDRAEAADLEAFEGLMARAIADRLLAEIGTTTTPQTNEAPHADGKLAGGASPSGNS
jgi:hypothetical protein